MNHKSKILIIENDPNDFNSLSTYLLKSKKYEIIPSEFKELGEVFDPNKSKTIEEYVKDIIEKNFNKNLKLIICDLNLNGLSAGHKLINSIRNNIDYEIKECKYFTALIPIIVFTNFPDRIENAIDFGANLGIVKPRKSSDGNMNNNYEEENEKIMSNLLAIIDSHIKIFEKTLQSIEDKSLPYVIKDRVKDYKKQYENKKTAFIMSSFSSNHNTIIKVIKETLDKYSIEGFIVENIKEKYLLQNIEVYMHGCDFGIGVFTQIDDNKFNSNTSLEVGYMMGLNKNVLLLKEIHFERLQSDLDGLLWEPFDAFNIESTIPKVLEKWLRDMNIITGKV